MPLQSREVLTLCSILDCDDLSDDNGQAAPADHDKSQAPFLLLPVEIRLKIFRYLLRIDRNRKAHTRRPPSESASDLLWIHSNRILEAPPFKHKSSQEINGSLPIIYTCQLQPALLRVCRKFVDEGRTVLYAENKVLGLQSAIKGMNAKLRNFGIPAWGPLPISRLASSKETSVQDEIKFNPVILLTGQNAKPTTPFYICSGTDPADFLHALWIMTKSSFARGIRYNVILSADSRHRDRTHNDSFVKLVLLPWLHSHINKIEFNNCSLTPSTVEEVDDMVCEAEQRLTSIRSELSKHTSAARIDANVYNYNRICGYFEQFIIQAEHGIDQGGYLDAELLLERVNSEACSMIRTRTAELVDVSEKSKEGINRICKVIAISAYRLCELRSGSLARIIAKDMEQKLAKAKSVTEHTNAEEVDDQSGRPISADDTIPELSSSELKAVKKVQVKNTKSRPFPQIDTNFRPATATRTGTSFLPKTTRLDLDLARDLAISNGLLALRLPCASPLYEWSIRVDIMLLQLFAEREDTSFAAWSVRRIKENCNLLWKDAKSKQKASAKAIPKYQALGDLVGYLENELKSRPASICFSTVAEKCQEVVSSLWGDRLRPRKAYVGLIWTFRWAN